VVLAPLIVEFVMFTINRFCPFASRDPVLAAADRGGCEPAL
jgi:hypothetical protein